MSRSYRKIPKISGGGTKAKRFASKTVRRFSGEIKDGNSYRKLYPSYDIKDYIPQCFDKNSKWYELLKRK